MFEIAMALTGLAVIMVAVMICSTRWLCRIRRFERPSATQEGGSRRAYARFVA
jgi:hypothetical protein